MLVRDVMTTEVVTATGDTTVPELIATMLRFGVSGLPVIDHDRHVVGVVTEADVVARLGNTPGGRTLTVLERALAGSGSRWARKAKGIVAGDIMTVPAMLASPTESLRSVAARMVTLGPKRMPVVDTEGRLVGIVSQRDLLRLFGRSDAQIRRSLQAALGDPLQCPDDHGVVIDVEGGVATLAGWAPSADDVSFIETLVGGEPGITAVRNNVIVDEPANACQVSGIASPSERVGTPRSPRPVDAGPSVPPRARADAGTGVSPSARPAGRLG